MQHLLYSLNMGIALGSSLLYYTALYKLNDYAYSLIP